MMAGRCNKPRPERVQPALFGSRHACGQCAVLRKGWGFPAATTNNRQEAIMFGLLKSAFDLAGDVVLVAIAPVEMVVDLAGAAVKPLAEVAKDLARDVKGLKD